MNIISNLKWRYATKRFDKTQKISPENIELLKEAINLAPTSYGLQPIKVLIIENEKIREKLKEAAWGQPQLTEASQIFLFCSYTKMGSEKVDEYLARRAIINNTKPEDTKAFGEVVKSKISNMSPEQLCQWTAKQAYIALGTLVAASAELHIDSCPMEGFDKVKFDEILELKTKGLTSAVMVAVGYRSDEDKTQLYKKTRKHLDQLFETV